MASIEEIKDYPEKTQNEWNAIRLHNIHQLFKHQTLILPEGYKPLN